MDLKELRGIKPLYSRSRVTRAGNNVREGKASDEDYKVIENWRSSHNKILNSWQATLRNRCRGRDVVFAQRLKRKVTIFDKLHREKKMNLVRMNDIAGCRLIFKSIEALKEFRNDLHVARMYHKRIKSSSYDYLECPKASGYRGIHDIFEYCARPGRDGDWNGLKVEIQYRTTAQHAWATAVEVAGSITGDLSKFNRGSNDQKGFFKLASEIIARAHEGLCSCFPEKSNAELCEEFVSTDKKIGLLKRLGALKAVKLDTKTSNVMILVYSGSQDDAKKLYYFRYLPEATKKYFELEKGLEGKDIVLVRGLSEDNIRKAYQNYFSDTTDFVKLVQTGIEVLKKS